MTHHGRSDILHAYLNAQHLFRLNIVAVSVIILRNIPAGFIESRIQLDIGEFSTWHIYFHVGTQNHSSILNEYS